MPRHAAFLRGVMPTNCSMASLRACFEAAGFKNVKTVLGSGNVVFDARVARKASLATIEQQIEAAVELHVGRRFETFVRSTDALAAMRAADPFAAHAVPANAKRVVTFLREPALNVSDALDLPRVSDGVHIVACTGSEVFTAYEPNPRGPVFMKVIEAAFGAHQTTRTWGTVAKCTKA